MAEAPIPGKFFPRPPLSGSGLRAERKAGQLLKQMEKAKGGGTGQKKEWSRQATASPTLAEIGITKKQSSAWQKLANVDEDQFNIVYLHYFLAVHSLLQILQSQWVSRNRAPIGDLRRSSVLEHVWQIVVGIRAIGSGTRAIQGYRTLSSNPLASISTRVSSPSVNQA